MQSQASKPVGTIGVPAILCALTGTILTVSIDFMGIISGPTLALSQYWEGDPFYLTEPMVLPQELNWLVAFVASWLVAYFTLASHGGWRRLLVGMMAVVVLLGFSPTLMLWGVLWIPFAALIAVLWTWACAALYGAQHAMPGEVPTQLVANDEISIKVETIPFPTKKKTK